MSWNPAEQIEDLAAVKLNSRIAIKKELRTLPTYLVDGEQVLNLSSGMYDGANGIVVATDRRVIFLSAGAFKSRFEDFPYDKISSVQHIGNIMFGELIIFASGNKAHMKTMLKDRAKEMGDYVRDRIGSRDEDRSVPAKEEDPIEKLRRLGELKEAGVLSDEEFETKKAELLRAI